MENSADIDELVRRAAGGDQQAVSDLLSRYRDRLRKMVQLRLDRRLYGRVDASDIVQDATLEAARRLSQYAESRPMEFFLWLRQLTGQKLIDAHRHHLGTQKRDADQEVSLYRRAMPEATSTALAAQLLGHLTSPTQAAQRAELQLKVQEALNNLDPVDREGLAKFEDDGHTRTGDIVGTLRYMSPERFQGQCDTRADVYSVGATLYELLLLKPAFESSNQLELMDQIPKVIPPRPRTVNHQIPRDLETIVLKAMEKETSRRYQSAEEMAEDLRRFLDDEPIHARRISLPERLTRWARRNRTVAALAASVFILLLSIATVSSVSAYQAEQRRAAEERLRRQAEEDAEEIRRLFYISDMNAAQQAWESGNVVRTKTLLDRQLNTHPNGLLCQNGHRAKEILPPRVYRTVRRQ